MKTEERLLTPDDVCRILGIRKSMLYRWTSEKKIPFIKLGNLLRFEGATVKNWL